MAPSFVVLFKLNSIKRNSSLSGATNESINVFTENFSSLMAAKAATLRWIVQLHKDVPKAARFYSDGLGFTVNVCTLKWAELQSGPLTIALMQAPKLQLYAAWMGICWASMSLHDSEGWKALPAAACNGVEYKAALFETCYSDYCCLQVREPEQMFIFTAKFADVLRRVEIFCTFGGRMVPFSPIFLWGFLIKGNMAADKYLRRCDGKYMP
ncbi:uncharacterized protein LOC131039340 isoform X1 [Cryptomeria japonica]|uniref:uncharacterized protein LOC131039340 isoform X1 n=1 Tax=Cryptomeria japonica TaxID=3369 RepID=UPI0025ACAF88|nr:uncharacterized protein LOC131039340 isoform X1 [Cryptomeria japonica]